MQIPASLRSDFIHIPSERSIHIVGIRTGTPKSRASPRPVRNYTLTGPGSAPSKPGRLPIASTFFLNLSAAMERVLEDTHVSSAEQRSQNPPVLLRLSLVAWKHFRSSGGSLC